MRMAQMRHGVQARATHAALTAPQHGLRAVVAGQDQVALRQILNQARPLRCVQHGAGGKADHAALVAPTGRGVAAVDGDPHHPQIPVHRRQIAHHHQQQRARAGCRDHRDDMGFQPIRDDKALLGQGRLGRLALGRVIGPANQPLHHTRGPLPHFTRPLGLGQNQHALRPVHPDG
jgi:hypothetical protein